MPPFIRLRPAAILGRLAYLIHRLRGHTVAWKVMFPQDSSGCSGDIVCEDCGLVLWCRAHDHWLLGERGTADPPADHWGGTRHGGALLQRLQRLLSAAGECPAGATGDALRRNACEVIEAGSTRERHVIARRMLNVVRHVERRRARGKSDRTDPSSATLSRVREALRDH